MALADALADLGDRRLDEVGRRPRLAQPGDAHDEVAQHLATNGRVHHLGVELDAVEVAAGIGQAGVGRRIGLRRRAEPFGRADDLVAVAHPHWLLTIDADEQPVHIGHGDGRWPVLALLRRDDLPAELVGHELEPVTDAEHRDPPGPQRRIGLRRVLVIDR